MRLLIIGALEGQLSEATKMAMNGGAKVAHAPSVEIALAALRAGRGADLLLVDVVMDIAGLIAGLEAERIAIPVVACGVEANAAAAVNAIRAGAKEYIPLPPDAELIAAVIAAVARDSSEFLFRDPAMERVVKMADQIAGSDASILITGESGTGKEVIAKYVHAKSKRANKPFISVNCAAIPEALLESELFGHEKGAFTGAIARRIGKFEEASGGTLLLDEISEMDVRLQSKLLRAIQERADRPRRRRQAGAGRYPHPRHLQPQPQRGRARRQLPRGPAVPPQRGQPQAARPARSPRRHRRSLRALRRQIRQGQRPAAARALARRPRRPAQGPLAGQCARAGEHPAPRRAAVLRRRHRPRCHRPARRHGPDRGRRHQFALGPARPDRANHVRALVGRTVADVERDLILDTLDHTLGNRTHAANILGISIRTLRNKLNQYADEGTHVPDPGERRSVA